jgi:uroporphyrinogen III methyltransferase/synthase
MSNYNKRTLVLARNKELLEESSLIFKNYGFNVIEFPALEIVPIADWTNFDNLIKNTKFDFLIFTSVNAAKIFHQRISYIKLDFNLEKTKIVAVGEKTANECTRLFNKVDIIPSLYSAEGLLKELKNINLFNKNILILKSSLSKEFLEIELKKLGANVFSEIIYKNTLHDRS